MGVGGVSAHDSEQTSRYPRACVCLELTESVMARCGLKQQDPCCTHCDTHYPPPVSPVTATYVSRFPDWVSSTTCSERSKRSR